MYGHAEGKAFLETVEVIRRRFPHLDAALGESTPTVDAFFELPAQRGLRFPISINLQGDELHLSAGAFSSEWFPCTDSDRANAFVEVVCGLISGDCRIVEHRSGGPERRPHKAVLQRLEAAGWTTVATWWRLHLPRRTSVRRTVLRNEE